MRRSLVVDRQRKVLMGGAGAKTLRHGQVTAPHLVFMGSPGTGKTHAARLVATLLRELGYVDGNIVEVQRADLVAGYVGQTALKTRDVINKAKGGMRVCACAFACACACACVCVCAGLLHLREVQVTRV